MISYKLTALLGLALYFMALLYVSLRRNKNETKEDFFLAGRNMPYWALSMTFVASWFGGTSALVSIDQAYEQGISAWWIIGSPSVAATIVLVLFAKAIRNIGAISQTEVIERRYSKLAGIIVSIIVVWYMITFASAQIVSLGKFFSAMFDTNYLTAVLIGVTVVAIYSSIGGFKAVVMTDMIQFVLLTLGLLLTAIVVLVKTGGWDSIQTAAAVQQKDDYFNFFANFKNNFFYLLSFGMAWIISADAWQRLSATKDAEEAKKMPLGGIVLFIPLYIIVAIIGVGTGALYTELPKGGIIAALAQDYLGPVLGTFVFLGIAAAIMSTMSAAINTGSLYATDFFNRYIKPDAESKLVVKVGIAATVAISIIATIISIRIPDALWVLWMSSDILAAGVLVPLLAAFLWKRGTSQGAVASILVGSSFVLYNFLIDLGIPLPTFWPTGTERILFGIGLGFMTFIVVSLLTKPDIQKAEQFMKDAKLRQKKRVESIPNRKEEIS